MQSQLKLPRQLLLSLTWESQKEAPCYLPRTQPGLFDIGTESSASQSEPELLPLLPKGLAA